MIEGFVQRELARIEKAIVAEPLGTVRFKELFAAQQALSWALEPNSCFASPLDSIEGRTGLQPSVAPDAVSFTNAPAPTVM